MRRRQIEISDEPESFSIGDVVAFLRAIGRPGFADLVNRLQSSLKAERAWSSTLSRRLQKLLPPPEPYREPYNPRPPAEASD